MCGRYTLSKPNELVDELREIFADEGERPFTAAVRTSEGLLEPRYNVAPTQTVPVVAAPVEQNRAERPARPCLEAMRWGLQSVWRQPAKAVRGAPFRREQRHKLLINARVETVISKASFAEPFSARRCLVLADGFYEWSGKKAGHQPHLLRLAARPPQQRHHPSSGRADDAATAAGHGCEEDRVDVEPGRTAAGSRARTARGSASAQLFCFAGIWNACRTASKGPAAEFALLTTAANRQVAPLHHRMPIALPRGTWRRWLAPDLGLNEVLELLALPEVVQHADWQPHPVSTRVNKVAIDDSDLLNEVAPPAVNLTLF